MATLQSHTWTFEVSSLSIIHVNSKERTAKEGQKLVEVVTEKSLSSSADYCISLAVRVTRPLEKNRLNAGEIIHKAILHIIFLNKYFRFFNIPNYFLFLKNLLLFYLNKH